MSNGVQLPSDLHQRAQFFHTALSLLLQKNTNSMLPEAMYILSPDQVLSFVSIFGGTTIRVPTEAELGKDLMAAVAIHLHDQQSWTWERVQAKLDLPAGEMKKLVKRCEEWKVASVEDIPLDIRRLAP